MKYKNILVTGGAGFVGSNLCVKLKEHYQQINVIALDNLTRRGSELNLPRLHNFDIKFVHGDVRNKEDLEVGKIDLLIECSAEPSVMAGINSQPDYVINTNLLGAIHCFEFARIKNADIVFLSSSRVYPIHKLNNIGFIEEKTRYSILEKQKMTGVSSQGINEKFSLEGIRSLYGTTKLTAELILQEYIENFGLKAIINRFGLIAGPWQMGKVDQGVVTLWLARHFFNKPLSYVGFGGKGKQVRDIIHIDDVYDILMLQLNNINLFSGSVYNIGGGDKNSISLLELTKICQDITGIKIDIKSILKTRPGDIKIYISDNTKITNQTGWKPKKDIKETIIDIHEWIIDNKYNLASILD